MMINYKGDKASEMLYSLQYGEEELQKILASHPQYLRMEGDSGLVLLGREIVLPSGNRLDLLYLSAAGLPIVVETKLLRNQESKRKVVAQVFEYVAELTEMSFDAVDDLLEGRLFDKISKLPEPILARKRFVAALRDGDIRIVVTIDKAANELIRILRFLKARNLDVQLIEVNKFRPSIDETSWVADQYPLGEPRTAENNTPRNQEGEAQTISTSVAAFLEFVEGKVPNSKWRRDRYYVTRSMEGECEARIEYSVRQQLVFARFKLWNVPKETVDRLSIQFKNVFGNPIYGNYRMERKAGRTNEWFEASLDPNGVGLESPQFRENVVGVTNAIIEKCDPVAQEIQTLREKGIL